MALATNDEGMGRPLSVKEISERAQSFEWNANIPFKHWMRTTQTLQQQVSNLTARVGELSGCRMPDANAVRIGRHVSS